MSSTYQQHPLHPSKQLPVRQRGGTAIGFIFGLVIGLSAALVVAVYVTKVPVPFLNKGASRTSTQDAAELQKNRNWDPNSPLYVVMVGGVCMLVAAISVQFVDDADAPVTVDAGRAARAAGARQVSAA